MRRSVKKNLNLNKLKTGCSPCMKEAKKMELKIEMAGKNFLKHIKNY